MKCYMLTLESENSKHTEELLKEAGWKVKKFYGYDNKQDPVLTTNTPYLLDDPNSDYKIARGSIGNILAHWMLWKALEHFGEDEYYHVMEDDVRLRYNWRKNLGVAMGSVPTDWDMIYAGSCCIKMELQPHVKNNVYKGCPLCTHWYMVKHKALKTLIETNSSAWGPIDIQINRSTAPKLNIYSILPRIADQYNTDLGESY